MLNDGQLGTGSRVRAGSQQRRRPGDLQCRPGAAPSSGPVARGARSTCREAPISPLPP